MLIEFVWLAIALIWGVSIFALQWNYRSGKLPITGIINPILIVIFVSILVVSWIYMKPLMAFVADGVESNPDWHCDHENLQAQCDGAMTIGHLVFTILFTIFNTTIMPIAGLATVLFRKKIITI
jgi:hypothetical protein